VDHYRVLEIVPKASTKEVQSAYQILKRAYDPETTHLSPFLDLEGLRAIQARVEEAYRTLIFLESRVAYDRHLVESGALNADQVRGLHGPVGAEDSPAAAGPGMAARPRHQQEAAAPVADTAPATSGTPSDPEPAASAVPAAVQPAPTLVSAPKTEGAAPDRPPVPGSGAALRAERLRSGLTLEAIAARTKIRQTYLQAIEEDRFVALPPPVFLRGFVREFASCLGLPADEAARAYLAARQKALEPVPKDSEGAPGQA
jgi:hypothetical protein